MREIEFRGKTENGYWVYGFYEKTPYETLINQWDNFGDHCVVAPVLADTVGQYTGLKDKNGVKIFEGDILRYEYIGKEYRCRKEKKITITGIVELRHDHGGWAVIDPAMGQSSYHIVAIQGWKIIGNIHDNPELLAGNKIEGEER